MLAAAAWMLEASALDACGGGEEDEVAVASGLAASADLI